MTVFSDTPIEMLKHRIIFSMYIRYIMLTMFARLFIQWNSR